MEKEELEHLYEQVYCSYCKGKRNHIIIKSYEENVEMFNTSGKDLDFYWVANYFIIKCAGCNTVAFLKTYSDENTWDMINGQREWIKMYSVYPQEPKEQSPEDLYFEWYKIELKNFPHAPENIYILYKQIVESYNNQHFILSTSGLRTLIEGICSQLNIKKGFIYDSAGNKIPDNDGTERKKDSLGGKIFGLFESNHILFTQALILQRIKVIGNFAIHDIVTPEFDDIKDIITVIEKVMYDVYELKNHSLLKGDNEITPS